MPLLDEHQNYVVKSKENLLVIAGPGSGKTTTIIAKVNYLITSLNETKILLISFTNKSVDDIKKKLNNPNVCVMTFHKLAIDILKHYNVNYKICNENLLDYIIDEYIKNLNKNDALKLCRNLNILKIDYSSFEYKNIKSLIKTFINLFKTNNHDFSKIYKLINNYNDKFLVKIILNIIYQYEAEKQSTNTLDFDDLIVSATKVLKKNYQYKKFKYIIVDEFQDTSLIRLNLIKEIYQNSDAIITAVGDDAQSIFHFSGCDLNIFLNFSKYFPNAKTVYLKNTYRNSQEIINISENFINKNPLQLKKNMQSFQHISKPIEIIYYFFPVAKFKRILNKVTLLSKNILIISRNYNDIYEYIDTDFKLAKDILTFNNHQYRYLTIHSSKGLEADYVIMLNVSDKKYGIPNKVLNHPILNFLETEVDAYPYAEERRVFFVGITRCKYKTYLLVPRSDPSPFVQEILTKLS